MTYDPEATVPMRAVISGGVKLSSNLRSPTAQVSVFTHLIFNYSEALIK